MGVEPRDLNVEYSGYVALAFGIGDPFPLNVPLLGSVVGEAHSHQNK